MALTCAVFHQNITQMYGEVSLLVVLSVFHALCVVCPAKLSAHIVVSVDYPEVAPLFIISIAWQSQRTAATDTHIKVVCVCVCV